MTPFTQQVFDIEKAMWSKDDLAKYEALIQAAQNDLTKKLAEMTCQNCGENWNDHSGKEALCPHPRKHENGWQIPYVEGQYFRGGEL